MRQWPRKEELETIVLELILCLTSTVSTSSIKSARDPCVFKNVLVTVLMDCQLAGNRVKSWKQEYEVRDIELSPLSLSHV